MENKINLLYKSIDDVVSSIRAFDLKSNILSALIIAILLVLSKNDTTPTYIIIVAFITISIFIFGVVSPRINPIDNINNLATDENYQNIFFPIGKKDIKQYFEKFKNMDDNLIIKVLTFERLKLQIILEQKMKYFEYGTYFVMLFFILSIVSVL